jgi:hypothetical protein
MEKTTDLQDMIYYRPNYTVPKGSIKVSYYLNNQAPANLRLTFCFVNANDYYRL